MVDRGRYQGRSRSVGANVDRGSGDDQKRSKSVGEFVADVDVAASSSLPSQAPSPVERSATQCSPATRRDKRLDFAAASRSMSFAFGRAGRKDSRVSLASYDSMGDESIVQTISRHLFTGYIVAQPTMKRFEKEPVRARLAHLVDSTGAQILMAIVTVISFVDVVADTDTRSNGNSLPDWVLIMHHFLFLAFLVELLTRLFVERCSGLGNVSTVADIVVVLSGIMEYVLMIFGMESHLSMLRILRLSRLLKLSRVVFGMPIFYELRKMISMIGSCFKTLFWSLLVLTVVLTSWSVVAVEILKPMVKELSAKGYWSDCSRCHRAFSSVFESNITFFQTIVAGDSWGKMAIPIIEAHPWTAIIFVGALLTIVFGVLNVIVAVVVDAFAEARAKDIFTRAHELALEEKREKKALADIFQKVDKNGDGCLDLDELKEGAKTVEMFSHWLRVLDIDAGDLEEMFMMLDSDGSGDVDADEFIEFMYRLKNSESRTATQFMKQKLGKLVSDIEAEKAALKVSKQKTSRQSSRIRSTRTSTRSTIESFGNSLEGITIESAATVPESVETVESNAAQICELPRIDSVGTVVDSTASDVSADRLSPSAARRSFSMPQDFSSNIVEVGESTEQVAARAASLPFLESNLGGDATHAECTGTLTRASYPDASESFGAPARNFDSCQHKIGSQVEPDVEPVTSADQPPGAGAPSQAASPSDPRPAAGAAACDLAPSFGSADAADATARIRSLPSTSAAPSGAVVALGESAGAPAAAISKPGASPAKADASPISAASTAAIDSPSHSEARDSLASIPQANRPTPFLVLLHGDSVTPPSCHRSSAHAAVDLDGSPANADVDLEAQRDAR